MTKKLTKKKSEHIKTRPEVYSSNSVSVGTIWESSETIRESSETIRESSETIRESSETIRDH